MHWSRNSLLFMDIILSLTWYKESWERKSRLTRSLHAFWNARFGILFLKENWFNQKTVFQKKNNHIKLCYKNGTAFFYVIRLNHLHPILSENKTKTMKQTLLYLFFLFSAYFNSQAQHVNVRLNFPTNISKRPSGRPPFRDACWIEPEWNWNGSRYDYVPGYWAKPHRNHLKWRAGHWKRTRRGFIWIPGRWRWWFIIHWYTACSFIWAGFFYDWNQFLGYH